MKKFRFLLMILCAQATTLCAQTPSPEAFLGYPLGAHYTPHYRIVQYFEAVAAANPQMVKLQKYGQTNEGRPLMVAFIGNPDNIAHLEDIRRNNLRLAGVLTDEAPTESTPVLVWLSYNVHGNEPSSSEAAMQTLYALVDPTNTRARDYLKNTLVIIDPCLNPDGRDRYVHWFNGVVGDNPDPNWPAREHDEPWPGGRTNHYNFDLNRDWFWQTQLESRKRVALYNEWLPQVHVDYHEQGVDAPYYFAPAAEPYHEVITRWQRDFQVAIGKNNARYFDQNGWLFFTKQEFDLFYPSYGDTYPIYNGSIGMTYEQGGGPRGGLAVLTETGDTLTLRDRILHHFTTGISTIEMGSQHATDLIREFHTYFRRSAETGEGPYQAYVVCADSASTGRINDLRALLDRNLVRYGTASGSVRGWDYFTRAQGAPYTLHPGDLVIPARQVKATLVKVLFEPDSKISDSATYDITAWSLPYVYGLHTIALKEAPAVHLLAPLPVDTGWVAYPPLSSGAPATNDPATAARAPATTAPATAAPATAAGAAPYGYLIPWTDIHSAAAMSYLVSHHVKVRVNQRPFEEGGRTFGAGSLLILATGNASVKDDFPSLMAQVAEINDVAPVPLSTGFVDKGFDFGSSEVRPLKTPRVAVLTGDNISSTSAGEIWYLFEHELRYPLALVNASNFARIDWNAFDVFILPDGYYPWMTDKKVSDALRAWVNQGGRLVALESAATGLANNDWGFKAKKSGEDKKDEEDKTDPYAYLKDYANRDRDELRGSVPGAIYRVDLDNTHPLAFGFPSYYYTLRQDNTVYQFMEEGWNVGILKKDNYVSGFVGSKARQQMEDGLLFGVEDMGRGKIVFLADDPLFRDFWENGKLLFCNAVFMVGN
ncbi:M14 family metallopeptidase [Dinghuibacter silviterrae]|uniref:Zinc carboxypeptidase n=1 Tax=Dinghuibacter silviterrae TaxID=1539049 RepID=A0A4R8DGN1_9BACT|nr:M14 family metallopeptidase [Dinghuibacter silviterrae]TDW96538.1 zinc carboxypeptidase [Dinghuibacter silviterrae]